MILLDTFAATPLDRTSLLQGVLDAEEKITSNHREIVKEPLGRIAV